MKEKYKCIYNMRLAGYLMMNGVRILRMEKNQGRPWRNVFIFKETEELMELIEVYKEIKSKENKYGNINENCSNKNNRENIEIL